MLDLKILDIFTTKLLNWITYFSKNENIDSYL